MKLGLVILLVENRALGRAPRYAEIRDTALWAEEAGFDSLWLYDHLLYREEGEPTIGIWECWTMLSALAEATRRVELGSLVNCNSFRNPAILAKMAATLDEVSGGRFILGLGAGWNEPEYRAFGLPFDHRVDRFEEALQIIRPLLRTGRVDFQGKYYQARDCEIKPRGPSPDGPPLLVGAWGPRMLRLTAQYADIWNTGYLAQPEELDQPLSELLEACQDVGRDPASLQKTVMIACGYPDLGEPPRMEESYLSGSKEQVADAIHGFETKGVEHLMFHVSPYKRAALERVAEVVQYSR